VTPGSAARLRKRDILDCRKAKRALPIRQRPFSFELKFLLLRQLEAPCPEHGEAA
jgi:hypothetical protein